jgi:hypothetical protein
MLKNKFDRPQTSRPVLKETKDERKVQDDLYVNVNMIDVLENYRKSVNFYNTWDQSKKK